MGPIIAAPAPFICATVAAAGIIDAFGNTLFSGMLATPFTPTDGELVIVPLGDIALTQGT